MEIYQPSDDSFLLSKFVEIEVGKKKIATVLDMGSGSGIQAETAIKAGINPKNIILADINPDAIKLLKKKFPESKVILSDLFSKIPKNSKFDLIIFNPPYLPDDKFDKKPDTSGGVNGSEIINKFLKQAKKYLSKNGRIFIISSNLTNGIDWNGYEKKLLEMIRVFFEELSVWELS